MTATYPRQRFNHFQGPHFILRQVNNMANINITLSEDPIVTTLVNTDT